MIQEIKTSWIAGLLEGEGCFSYRNDKNYASIQFNTTDFDIMTKYISYLRELGFDIKNKIVELKKKKSTHKQGYAIEITSKKAIGIMKLILPFMGIRRKNKIKEIINVSHFPRFT